MGVQVIWKGLSSSSDTIKAFVGRDRVKPYKPQDRRSVGRS